MQRIEYRTVDKSAWGDGPWQSEPDKIQWQDAATGYPCLIVRNGEVTGALCGYVGVSPNHPAHGLHYDGCTKAAADLRKVARRKASALWMEAKKTDPNAAPSYNLPEAPVVSVGLSEGLEVHGGLTFADGCGHGEEDRGICHKPDPGEPDNVWWFGFDCAHACDIAPAMSRDSDDVYRDVSFVTAECESLAKQLKAMEESNG